MRRLEAIALAVVFLLSFGLRFYRLDRPGLSHDEALTIYLAAMAYPKSWFLDVHPPLHYAFYRLWLGLFPWRGSEVPVRAPQALCGSLVPVLVYGLFRPLMGWRAFIPSFSLAISPFFISYSRNAWRYGIVPFLCLLSTFFFLRALRREKGGFLLYIISALLALAYQWALIGTLAAHAFFLLLYRRREFRPLLLAQALVAGGILIYVRLHMAWLQARIVPLPFLEGLKGAGLLLFKTVSCPIASYPSPVATGWMAELAFVFALLSFPLLPLGILWLWKQGEGGRLFGLVFMVQTAFIAFLTLTGLSPFPWYATFTGGLPVAIVQAALLQRESRSLKVYKALWWPMFFLTNIAGAKLAILGVRQEVEDNKLVVSQMAPLEREAEVIVSDSALFFLGPRAFPLSLYRRLSKPIFPSPWTWCTATGAYEGREGKPLDPEWRKRCALLCQGKRVLAVWFTRKNLPMPMLRTLLLRTHKLKFSQKVYSTFVVEVWLELFLPKDLTKTAALGSR